MPDHPAQHPTDVEPPTAVVTCFLMRRDRGQPEVLLVRRSDRVRTYRGRWAAISGYVEANTSPREQAHVELVEETGLPREGFRLLREGAPLAVRDSEQGLNWTVHPYLFEVAEPDRINLDWEAAEARWVDPAEMLVLPTVPRLADAYARVVPGAESPA